MNGMNELRKCRVSGEGFKFIFSFHGFFSVDKRETENTTVTWRRTVMALVEAENGLLLEVHPNHLKFERD